MTYSVRQRIFHRKLANVLVEHGAATHPEDQSVLEVGVGLLALLAAERAVTLVHHLLVAAVSGTRLRTKKTNSQFTQGNQAQISEMRT